jgi:hypothetical protein
MLPEIEDPTPKPAIFKSPLRLDERPAFQPELWEFATLWLSPVVLAALSVLPVAQLAVWLSAPLVPLLIPPPLIQLLPLPSEWLTEVELVSARLTVCAWLSVCAHDSPWLSVWLQFVPTDSECAQELPTECVSLPPLVQASLTPCAWLSVCACPQPWVTPCAEECATACVPACPPDTACPNAASSGTPTENPMFTLPRLRLAKLLATRATSTSARLSRWRSMCSAVT